MSIHGIRSEGEWQEAFKDVFEPHFRFVSFKYGQFRHSVYAVLWVALELWVVIVGVIVTAFALARQWLPTWQGWTIAVCVWLLIFLAANQLAEKRRDTSVSEFLEAMDLNLAFERRPHIIAHSLGSFIIGRMLERYRYVSVAHVILMGCVLTRRYAWTNLLHRFDMVRNEVAGRDWVAAIAFFLRSFVPEMGPSGIFGFSHSAGLVRTLQESDFGNPWRPCINGCACGWGKIEFPDARVLNVRCAKIGHNDIARRRARLVWLPFLWNLPPALFGEFVELCGECATLDAQRQYATLNVKVDELRQRCWFWTRGKLGDYVAMRLAEARGEAASEATLAGTLRNLYLVVDRAARHDAGPHQQRSLYPEFAIQDALDQTVLAN
jgi:pimeloyl-ACP methyl ester carboxylesterase